MQIKVTHQMAGVFKTMQYCNIQHTNILEIDGITLGDLSNNDGESWADVKARIQKAQKACADLTLAEFKRFHKDLEELPERYVCLPHGDE